MATTKVLIAEDDKELLWVLEKFFEEKGCDVVSVQDGNAAAGVLKAGDATLALLDINMPGKDGLQVLKEAGSGVPVIIMTAEGTMKNTLEAMKRGAFDYITKPFDLDELCVIV